MTRNNLRKSNLVRVFDEVEPNREDYYDPHPYRDKINELEEVLRLETGATLDLDSYGRVGENLILNSVKCACSSLRYLFQKDFYSAWWEMTDMISHRKKEEYLSEDELALLYLVLHAFQCAMRT